MKFLLVIPLMMAMSFSAMGKSRVVGRKTGDSNVKTASNRFKAEGLKLRKERRAAIGTKVGGSLGFIGANIELNFTPYTGFLAGYGGGKGYQAYSFELKQYIGGDSFLPYFSTGFAHWFGRERDGGLQESRPNFLAEKFLTDAEKVTGKFSLDMVYPSLGVQYVKLEGDYAGMSIFAEVVMMIEISEFKSAPTGSVGLMYYF